MVEIARRNAGSGYTSPPIVRVEPVITVVRFKQAANRLEVLRGIGLARDKLLSRLVRKYHAINMRDDVDPRLRGLNFRMVDMGPADAGS